jgi:hypothetical protein
LPVFTEIAKENTNANKDTPKFNQSDDIVAECFPNKFENNSTKDIASSITTRYLMDEIFSTANIYNIT